MNKNLRIFFEKYSFKKKPIFAASLRPYTSFQCLAKAKVILKICTQEELEKILIFCKEQKLPYLILGKGSNSIFTDNGFHGILLLLDGDFKQISLLANDQVSVGAGASTTRLANWLKKNSLGGGEFLLGIPASVGGLVFMNAGANNQDTQQILLQVTSYSLTNGLQNRDKNKVSFDYRYSSFMDQDEIITNVIFQLFPRAPKLIEKKQTEILTKRKQTQPIYALTWGSVFQNPNGYYAADLIEKCGFKGKFFGGLQVSNKHSNFFENKKNAKFKDVQKAISQIQKKVWQEYQVFLHPEVRIFDNKGMLIKKFYQSF